MNADQRVRGAALLWRAGASVRTAITPPRLSSLPGERQQLENSSRSLVFARDGRRLLRAWGPSDRPYVLAVEEEATRWRVEAWGCGPALARRAVRTLFSLDDDLDRFYRLTRADPVLRGTEVRFRGLRLPRDPNLYEALLHAVVGQQLSVAAANAIKHRLLQRWGSVLVAGGVEVPVLPSPAALLDAGPRALRSAGLSRTKAAALVGLAAWSPRAPRAEVLRRADLPRACAMLEELHGVGRWTAENALLRGAGRRDVFVAGDLGVRAALARYALIPRSAPEARARAWAELRYPGWGSYATLYLWRKLVADARAREAG